MQLQQLRYVIAIAQSGSMNSVARKLFISQSSLSVAVKELESELGIRIFNRSSKGISLTSDGVEFLGYARQVVEQADLLTDHYTRRGTSQGRMSVSTQHYAFAVRAFINFLQVHGGSSCDFSLRETRTSEIIDDVRTFRSDIGILFLSHYNETVIRRRLDEGSLVFTSLFHARPHVFVREGHPLASRRTVTAEDLAPFERYDFEQGAEASLYLSEEPLGDLPHARHITVSDRATMTGILSHCDGYLISTGVRSDEMFSGIASIPIETDEVMNVGYITHSQRRLSGFARDYIRELERLIVSFDQPEEIVPSKAALKSVAAPTAAGAGTEA